MYYNSAPINKPELNQLYPQAHFTRPMVGNNEVAYGNINYNGGYQNNYSMSGELIKTPLMLYGQLPGRQHYTSQRLSGQSTQKKKPYKKAAV